MSNTTDMIITCFDEDDVIEKISQMTEINFKKVSNGELAGGQKSLIFESYGVCYRSLGLDKINEVIETFKNAPFRFPELAVLLIDDDDIEDITPIHAVTVK